MLRWSGRPKGHPDATISERRRGLAPCSEGLKLVLRRQASGQSGSDCRKVVRRQAGSFRATLRGQRGESHALGSRAIHECSCRKSIAEVGEKHLLRAPPRGAERRTEVARGSTSRRLVLDEGESNDSGDKGARSFART